MGKTGTQAGPVAKVARDLNRKFAPGRLRPDPVAPVLLRNSLGVSLRAEMPAGRTQKNDHHKCVSIPK